MVQRVVVADRHHHVPGTDPQPGALYRVALQQLKVFLHVLLGQRVLAPVNAFRDGKDQEERAGKSETGNRGNRLGEQVQDGGTQQHQENREESNWYFMSSDREVRWDFPAALSLVLDAQHQHGKAVEGEAPDHSEGVGFAQQVNVAAADQNGEYLQQHHQVDDPVA